MPWRSQRQYNTSLPSTRSFLSPEYFNLCLYPLFPHPFQFNLSKTCLFNLHIHLIPTLKECTDVTSKSFSREPNGWVSLVFPKLWWSLFTKLTHYLPEVDYEIWLPEVDYEIWKPGAIYEIWLRDVIYEIWLPMVNYEMWVPKVSYEIWPPEVDYGIWLPEVDNEIWLPDVSYEIWLSMVNHEICLQNVNYENWVPEVSYEI